MRKLAALFLSCLSLGCGQRPRVDVVPAVEDGQIVFNISYSGINGILGFDVMEGEEKLWSIGMSYEKGHKIVYGLLPTGGNMAAQQSMPANGAAPPDIRGKTVNVRVTYQYDSGISACAGSIERTVVIP
jgi:hypothetical protein